ncbi:MAG TPA: acyl-CoA dehydrogenase family protein [Acidimicrobiales bacterium]|nr:acyl-CoA dehydrogenase family protein [Acidimicrobiales bacterium]
MASARRVAEDLLAPSAEATDQSPVVPAGHLRALAEAGLDGLSGPVDAGGAAAPAAVSRLVYEVLAGACGVTFFVWVQHHAPVRMLATSANAALRRRWLPALCRGDLLGGVAFAYLRRPGPPAVAARPVAGGWVVHGEAPWVTSWGLAGLYAVAASTGDDVVFFALTTDPPPTEVTASAPLPLAAMAASATVRVTFDGLFVPADDVIATVPVADWRARDRLATARPHPAPLGVAARAVRLLSEIDGQPAVAAAAADLAGELARCREHAYGLDTGAGDDDAVAALVRARAWGLDLALRAASAVVAATGGGAMALTHPGQRLVREAAFYSIQAQTPELRRATLDRLTGRQGWRS